MVHTTKISKVVVCYFGYKSFGFCVGASFGTKYQPLHFIFWVCFWREGLREGEEGVGWRGGGCAGCGGEGGWGGGCRQSSASEEKELLELGFGGNGKEFAREQIFGTCVRGK
jgi:hypothetical protein